MYHPQVSRRVAIQAGSVGLLGLGMNHLEPLQAMAADKIAAPTAKNVIYIFLSGGLAQHESFDPKPDDTLIDKDHSLIAQHIQFQQMICDAGAEDNEKKDSNEISKWVIRIELEREAMMERNINMDDIHFAIKNVLKTSE